MGESSPSIPGVGQQDVHAAPTVHRRLHVSLRIVRRGNVSHGVTGLILANRLHRFPQRRLVQVDQREPSPLVRKYSGGGPTDATRGPGD